MGASSLCAWGGVYAAGSVYESNPGGDRNSAGHSGISSDTSTGVEPGYTMIRKPDGTAQVYGKVVIDMRNGDIWGFPTLAQGPYPVDTAKTTPPKSYPMYLGKFMFSEAQR